MSSSRMQTLKNEFPPLVIPEVAVGGILFDCDGTLVDSMPVHFLAWTDALREHHAPYAFTEAMFYGYAGIREQDIVHKLNLIHGCKLDPDAVSHTKSALYRTHIESLLPVGPVIDVVEATRMIPQAVVSGSPRDIVLESLAIIGYADRFPVVITPEDVAPGRGKPHPDMFLLAARLIDVAPEHCLVFEDGQSGIDAATAAKMPSVFVPRGLGRPRA